MRGGGDLPMTLYEPRFDADVIHGQICGLQWRAGRTDRQRDRGGRTPAWATLQSLAILAGIFLEYVLLVLAGRLLPTANMEVFRAVFRP